MILALGCAWSRSGSLVRQFVQSWPRIAGCISDQPGLGQGQALLQSPAGGNARKVETFSSTTVQVGNSAKAHWQRPKKRGGWILDPHARPTTPLEPRHGSTSVLVVWSAYYTCIVQYPGMQQVRHTPLPPGLNGRLWSPSPSP